MPISELSSRILNKLAQDILAGDFESGDHVSAQQIADRYSVSRTPVVEAMTELENAGILEHVANRGYFVADEIPESAVRHAAGQKDNGHANYQLFAEDWLTDELPEIVTELKLRQRYGWTKNKTNEMLARAAREGWAERKEGYGWRLLPVAKTVEAFDAIYRFRIAIEPVAMLEPTFEIDKKVLSENRRIQEKILETDVRSVSAEWLLGTGSQFHEDLIKMSQNPFFFGALERVNKMRRLMEYRARVDREHFTLQCTEHLHLIDLLEQGELVEASYFMRRHLSGALQRKSRIARTWSSDPKADLEPDTEIRWRQP